MLTRDQAISIRANLQPYYHGNCNSGVPDAWIVSGVAIREMLHIAESELRRMPFYDGSEYIKGIGIAHKFRKNALTHWIREQAEVTRSKN